MFPWLEALVQAATATDLPAEAREYLTRRGVSPADLVSHRIGWLPAEYGAAGYPAEFHSWQRRALREALIFPLCTVRGDVIGLQTRKLDEKRYEKFLAGPPDVYPPVFGLPMALPEIWRTEQAVVVEGVFDYFAVRPFAPNVVASLTASVPMSVCRFLSRYTQRVIALLDMDDAGRGGVDLLIREGQKLGYHVFAPHYQSHDPGDMVADGLSATLAALVTPARFQFEEM